MLIINLTEAAVLSIDLASQLIDLSLDLPPAQEGARQRRLSLRGWQGACGLWLFRLIERFSIGIFRYLAFQSGQIATLCCFFPLIRFYLNDASGSTDGVSTIIIIIYNSLIFLMS
jgi:hypothetical protein